MLQVCLLYPQQSSTNPSGIFGLEYSAHIAETLLRGRVIFSSTYLGMVTCPWPYPLSICTASNLRHFLIVILSRIIFHGLLFSSIPLIKEENNSLQICNSMYFPQYIVLFIRNTIVKSYTLFLMLTTLVLCTYKMYKGE